MLLDLTNENLVRLGIEAVDWKDAIRQAAAPLLEAGKITAGYIDEIIHGVEEIGPYIVLTKHVALPHARPEAGALESAIGIATLKTPVKFGNRDNDPVKYMFCLSARDNESHIQALGELTELLSRPDFYALLDKADTAKEVIQYIKNIKA